MQAGTTLTRGPLPPGVYWRRRLLLLVVAAVLVFVIAQLLGGGSNGKGGGPVAQQAGAVYSTSTESGSPTDPTTAGTVAAGPTYSTPTGHTTSTAPLVLAAPSGPCAPSDIKVVPSVPRAIAGSDVTINLALQTTKTAACTWDVDQHDIVVKIARHGTVLWTSQKCPAALPARSVVIRNVVPSIVTMVWNARFSTAGCRSDAGFVYPGTLGIYAATLGGEPGHAAFTLAVPTQQTVTASPTQTATSKATSTGTAKATSTATPKAR
ncbi:MAG TPA: hypothetical protein VJ872_13050 [Nocardioides sp.]|nr:hypothetical protein [Nocardioides sp.]